METIGDGVYDWNVATNVVIFAPSYYTMAGYEPDDFPMDFENWASRVHPDDISRVGKDVEDFMSGRTQTYHPQFRFRRKDGSWMWIMARAKIVERGENGEPLRVIGVHTDIDQYIRAQNALMQSEARMTVAKEEAEVANRAKSEFLASMSHELRTPLNAVLGFAQMLQLDPDNSLSTTQNEHVENILTGGNHLLELVNDILDLAKVEAHQLDLSLEEVTANEVIANCVALTAPLGKPRGIRIVDQFSDGSARK